MKRIGLAVLMVLGLAATGCSAIQAIQEPANTVATIQRMQNIEKTLDHAERLLLETPIVPGDSWLDHMDPTDAELKKITADWKDSPGAVPEIHMVLTDVYAVAWEKLGGGAKKKEAAKPEPVDKDDGDKDDSDKAKGEKDGKEKTEGKKAEADEGDKDEGDKDKADKDEGEAAEAPAAPAKVPGQVAANMIALLGPEIERDYMAYKAATDAVAAKEGEIAKLEKEGDKEGISEAETAELDKKIEAAEAEKDKLDEAVTAAEDKLDATMETAKVDCSRKDLLVKVLAAMSRFNRVYLEAASLGTVLLYHFGRATPDFDNQIQVAAKGWIREAVRKQTGKALDWAVVGQLKIGFKLNGFSDPPSITVDGQAISNIDPVRLTADAAEMAFEFVKAFVTFPATYGISMSKIASQRSFVGKSIDLVEAQCGIEAPPLVDIDLSAAVAVDVSASASASAATK
jgi:hypothetical protein